MGAILVSPRRIAMLHILTLLSHSIEFSGCQPGSVRLAGGPSPQEGRIELCVQSSPGVTIWGSVCNAGNYGTAEVVCRQLNYSRSGSNRVKIDLHVSEAKGIVKATCINVCVPQVQSCMECHHMDQVKINLSWVMYIVVEVKAVC